MNSLNRRDFLRHPMGPCGTLALSWLLTQDGFADTTARDPKRPLAPRMPHHKPRAKSVIFMFMTGGPSQMDLFDPKPELARLNGQPLPPSFGKPISQFTKGDTAILASTRKFKKHGKSGMWMSDLLPNLATCADDLCYLNSCFCTSTVHAPAMYELHSGRTLMGYPSLGSWVTYGLGTSNENLPAYCVMIQPEGTPEGGAPCWSNAFLPSVYQGTLLRKGKNPILHLKPPADVSPERQKSTLDFLKTLNEKDLDPSRSDLAARIASYELAFRMQSHAPEAVDLAKETQVTRDNYGLEDKKTADFGTRCLLARRLVERGVRFVQIYSGGGPLITQWDAHDDVNSNHERMCGHVDKPIAALLKDLKHRGLLDSTLVVWASEFGRLPNTQGGYGRDHNPHGFTMWMAGGGVRGGAAIGQTDELGLHAIDKRISVNDFHATLLHLLGLDHEKLIYPHGGRDERLTDVSGRVVEEVLA